MRALLLTLVFVCACQQAPHARPDAFPEGEAIRQAKQAMQDVGAPVELYAEAFDPAKPFGVRLDAAARLLGALDEAGLSASALSRVGLAVAVMLSRASPPD